MEALEFLKEERRMCEFFEEGCVKCLLRDTKCRAIPGVADAELEKEVAIVEQWSKEHPRKTRQSVFLKQFPEASISADGVLTIDSCKVEKSMKCNGMNCAQCRREFWMQEVD